MRSDIEAEAESKAQKKFEKWRAMYEEDSKKKAPKKNPVLIPAQKKRKKDKTDWGSSPHSSTYEREGEYNDESQ